MAWLLTISVLLGLAAAEPDVARARGLEKQAHDLQAAGKYKEAEQPLLDAITVWKKLRGAGDIEVLNDEMNLAVSYRRRGEAKRAALLLKQVVTGFKSSKDKDAPALHREALNNLAAAHRQLGEFREAIEQLKSCLSEIESGPPTEERARVLDNLASTNIDSGNPEAAARYAYRGLTDWRALRGDDHPDTAISMSNLGTLKMRSGRFAEARPLLENSLRILEHTRGAEHPEAASVLILLGELDWRTGRVAAARAELERALAILRKRFDDTHPLVKDAVSMLAEVDAKTKRP